jgi:methionyl-tRNA formyltransferase
MMSDSSDIPFVYFGTPNFSVAVLEELKKADLLPTLIVTAPDRERGRGQKLQPTPVKSWAQDHGIDTLTPETIDAEFIAQLNSYAPEGGWPLFVVVAYGEILPPELINLPEHNTLNLHPSLLPKVRGAAPIRGTILQEDDAGVTIIELDEQMDHGPIVAQQRVKTDRWPPRYDELKPRLAQTGGQLLAETIPSWVKGNTEATAQYHGAATYIEKFDSDDGYIDFNDNPETNLRKIRAFTNWPKAHFYTDDDTRVVITGAHIAKGDLVIDTVKPAGEQEMRYQKLKEKN